MSANALTHHHLTNEWPNMQLTALLQATAGVYQDLRMEIKKRMRVFEEYALAEILRLPPGLLADPSSGLSSAELEAELAATEEEEESIDKEMKALQLEVSERKQRGRDIKATMKYLDVLVKDVKEKMKALETVPNVLGSTKALEKDVEFVVEKGGQVVRGMGRLEALEKAEGGGKKGEGVDGEMVELMKDQGDRVGVDADVGKRVGGVMKQAEAAEGLRAFRESLLEGRKDT